MRAFEQTIEILRSSATIEPKHARGEIGSPAETNSVRRDHAPPRILAAGRRPASPPRDAYGLFSETGAVTSTRFAWSAKTARDAQPLASCLQKSTHKASDSPATSTSVARFFPNLWKVAEKRRAALSGIQKARALVESKDFVHRQSISLGTP